MASTPTNEDAIALFKAIEKKFPDSLGGDRWYLVAVSTL